MTLNKKPSLASKHLKKEKLPYPKIIPPIPSKSGNITIVGLYARGDRVTSSPRSLLLANGNTIAPELFSFN